MRTEREIEAVEYAKKKYGDRDYQSYAVSDFLSGFSRGEASRDHEVRDLKEKIKLLEDPSYCPICGSCGTLGCCGAKRCLYPDQSTKDLILAEQEADELREKLNDANAKLEVAYQELHEAKSKAFIEAAEIVKVVSSSGSYKAAEASIVALKAKSVQVLRGDG